METSIQQTHAKEHSSWLFSPAIDVCILIGIIALAIYLRSFGVDHGRSYHPDERHMIMVTQDLEKNGMNPTSFAYGSFSFYALWYASRLARFVWNLSNHLGFPLSWPDPTGYDGLIRVGRVLCLVIGVTSIPILYGLALKMYRSSAVGLLAAILLSVNVFHIQLSRFFTSDITLTTLSLASIFALVTVYQSGTLLAYLCLGVFLGLATATKISSVFLATPLLLTLSALLVRDHGWKQALGRALLGAFSCLCVLVVALWTSRSLLNSQPLMVFQHPVSGPALLILAAGPLLFLCSVPLRVLSPHLGRTSLALGIAATVFVIAEPFAVFDYATFTRHTQEQTSMVQGLWRPPYTIQYENTVPYFYHLKQMLWYTMGVPVFSLVVVGFFLAALRTATHSIIALFNNSKNTQLTLVEAIPMIFVVVFFIATAGFQVKFPRYLMPLYPILFLFAGSVAVYARNNSKSTPDQKLS